jgi:hypothetical protein
MRELTVLRLLELCYGLEAEPTRLLSVSLQRVELALENLVLHVDLRALLKDRKSRFRPMAQWARSKLDRCPDGIAEVTPPGVGELADLIGCTHLELATHLARFAPGDD